MPVCRWTAYRIERPITNVPASCKANKRETGCSCFHVFISVLILATPRDCPRDIDDRNHEANVTNYLYPSIHSYFRRMLLAQSTTNTPSAIRQSAQMSNARPMTQRNSENANICFTRKGIGVRGAISRRSGPVLVMLFFFGRFLFFRCQVLISEFERITQELQFLCGHTLLEQKIP